MNLNLNLKNFDSARFKNRAKTVLCIFISALMILPSFTLLPVKFTANAAASPAVFGASGYNNASFEIIQDGTDLKLYAKNCVDLASFDFRISFSPDAVSTIRVVSGYDAKQVNSDNFRYNSFTYEANTSAVNNVMCAAYFKEVLWSTEKFTEEAFDDIDINGEYFHLLTFKLRLNDAVTANDISVSSVFCSANFYDDSGSSTQIDDLPINITYQDNASEIPSETPEESTTKAPEEITTETPEEPTSGHLPEASGNARAALTVGEIVNGQFDVILSLQNCLELTSGDLLLKYNTAALEFVPFVKNNADKQCEILDDAKKFTNAGNRFLGFANANATSGQVNFAFTFMEYLDAERWNVDVDMADVKLFRMTFRILDSSDTELMLTGALNFLDDTVLNVNETFSVELHTHSYTQIIVLAPDCVNAGINEFVCACGESYRTEISAIGHTSVTDAAIVATCTTAGKTEGSHCSVCNTVIKPQETIPIKEHTAITDNAVAATCTTEGKSEGTHCSVCNTVIKAQTAIPAKGHNYTDSVTTPATCTAEGIRTFKCSVCAHSYTEKIVSLGGHKLTWTVTKQPTSFEEGANTGKCTVCGHTETKAIEKLPEIDVKPEIKEEIKIAQSGAVIAFEQVSVSTLLDNIPEKAEIVTQDGKKISDAAVIATGMKVILKDDAGKIVDEKTIVVPGDVDCDGSVSSSDARATLRKAVGLDKLKDYQEKAADVEADTAITSSDARDILRASVGLIDKKDFFNKAK